MSSLLVGSENWKIGRMEAWRVVFYPSVSSVLSLFNIRGVRKSYLFYFCGKVAKAISIFSIAFFSASKAASSAATASCLVGAVKLSYFLLNAT